MGCGASVPSNAQNSPICSPSKSSNFQQQEQQSIHSSPPKLAMPSIPRSASPQQEQQQAQSQHQQNQKGGSIIRKQQSMYDEKTLSNKSIDELMQIVENNSSSSSSFSQEEKSSSIGAPSSLSSSFTLPTRSVRLPPISSSVSSSHAPLSSSASDEQGNSARGASSDFPRYSADIAYPPGTHVFAVRAEGVVSEAVVLRYVPPQYELQWISNDNDISSSNSSSNYDAILNSCWVPRAFVSLEPPTYEELEEEEEGAEPSAQEEQEGEYEYEYQDEQERQGVSQLP